MGHPSNEEFIQDLISRTRKNLEFIEKAEKEGNRDVFEITQLINSMLMLIISPIEEVKGVDRDFSLNPEEDNFFINLTFIWNKHQRRGDRLSARETIEAFRHAFAHGNINFIGTSLQKIDAIALWNIPPGQLGQPKANMIVEINPNDLKTAASHILNILTRVVPNEDRRELYKKVKSDVGL